MSEQEKQKAQAGRYAARLIGNNMIVGLGTGSTAQYFLQELAKRIRNSELHNIKGIASSRRTEEISRDLQIPLTTYDEHQHLDITVDGADEVDPDFNLIKGGGGALLREKIMAQASKRYVIIADESKYSLQLGTRFSIPVEVLPYALPLVMRYLKDKGAQIQIRQNEQGTYYQTDQGNYIVDCNFGPITDTTKLSVDLKLRAGIMEHGLFLSLATDIILATPKEIKHLKK